jgi:hypothetical protein
MQLTIFFDSPFWVGVLEEEHAGTLYAARQVFGAEPSDQQVYEFVLHDLAALRAQMVAGVTAADRPVKRLNPKRLQREIRRDLARAGVSSKAHEALRLQLEQHKQSRQEITREQRDAEREHKRAIQRDKARQKHRGR